MFNSRVTTLIRYFNQYGRIPNAIPAHYVASCLNESRRRQIHPVTPIVIYVTNNGAACQAVNLRQVGGLKTYYRPI